MDSKKMDLAVWTGKCNTVISEAKNTYKELGIPADNLPDGIDYIETVDVIGADVVQGAVLSNNGRTVTWVITNVSANSTAVIIIRTNTTINS